MTSTANYNCDSTELTLNVAKNRELVKSISNLESKTFENYVSWKSNVTTELKYLRDIDISPVVKELSGMNA